MELLVAALLTIAAVAAVVYPLIRGDGAGVPLESEETGEVAPTDVEREVADYRAALRAGTLCRRCGRAGVILERRAGRRSNDFPPCRRAQRTPCCSIRR